MTSVVETKTKTPSINPALFIVLAVNGLLIGSLVPIGSNYEKTKINIPNMTFGSEFIN